MAILKEFKVSIIVDGNACHEYRDVSNSEMDRVRNGRPPQVSSYIEALPEAYFTVRVGITSRPALGRKANALE